MNHGLNGSGYGMKMNRKERRSNDIYGQAAFREAFVQAEMLMRMNLAARIQDAIDKETDDNIKSGLTKAKEIVFGTNE